MPQIDVTDTLVTYTFPDRANSNLKRKSLREFLVEKLNATELDESAYLVSDSSPQSTRLRVIRFLRREKINISDDETVSFGWYEGPEYIL